MKITKFFFVILAGVLGSSYQGICDFNPFEQRKIVVQQFENRGEPQYDYVKEGVEVSIYNYALSIPFVLLTDEEIGFFKKLSELDEYRDLFEEAGGTIRYRLESIVARGAPVASEFPISIYGYYRVQSEEEVDLSITAYNSVTGNVFTEYETREDLFTILNKPEVYLVPFFKKFLRYKTYTVSITADPEDALLTVDDRFIGIGKSPKLLLPPGYHRITVKRDGYKSYSDLASIDRDAQTIQVVLKEEKKQSPVSYTSTPPGAKVYLGEQFQGETPLSVGIFPEDRTLTFVKKGYARKTLLTQEITEGTEQKQVKLITEEEKEKILNNAELHRKSSEILYYTGIGMLGLSVLLGIEATSSHQQADLYRGVDPARHAQALDTTNTLGYLTAASSAVTAGILVFSFIEILKYFDLYNYNDLTNDGNPFKKEVRF
jgi:hypothetical protein